MKACEAGNACDLFIQTRVVLHRAGAEWVHALIDRVVPRRHANEVTNYIHFTYFRNALEVVVSKKLLRHYIADGLFVDIECRQAIADAAWLRTLKDQSFVGVNVSCDFGYVRVHRSDVLLVGQTVNPQIKNLG